jgi:hypothetical protein
MLITLQTETQRALLASRVQEATTHWTRFRGLMGRRALADGEGLVIKPCKSIHMMFMRFPIDAVFFNKEGTVTSVSTSVRPWIGMAWGGRGAVGVIELPAGAAADVAVGDSLEFEE